MFDVPFRLDQPFDGTIDLEAIVRTIPADYLVKGMFCTRFVEIIGADFARLAPTLAGAPRAGRYLPFKDYPQSDYSRLCYAAAIKRFPRLSVREALRCIARDDLATFADSMIGKIVLSLAGDAHTTLLRTPDAYNRVAPGGAVHARDLDPRTTRLTFDGYRGIMEYTVGQLEGVCINFKRDPIVTVRKLSEDSIAFDVVHGG